jgi:acetyl-CoA carboxylase biotin carboxyl carrier protein
MADPRSEHSPSVLDGLCQHAVQLIEVARGPLRRVKLQAGDASVELEWPDPAVSTIGHGPAGAVSVDVITTSPAPGPGMHELCAPMVGTFYRALEPGAPPLVNVGDTVEAGQQVGLIEAMKLMTPVESDRAGRVVEFLVPDGSPVEYEQPLIVLDEPFSRAASNGQTEAGRDGRAHVHDGSHRQPR